MYIHLNPHRSQTLKAKAQTSSGVPGFVISCLAVGLVTCCLSLEGLVTCCVAVWPVTCCPKHAVGYLVAVVLGPRRLAASAQLAGALWVLFALHRYAALIPKPQAPSPNPQTRNPNPKPQTPKATGVPRS